MKCLSLWQPWAALMVLGAKRFETRSWSTTYQGPLLIHASRLWTEAARNLCLSEPFATALGIPQDPGFAWVPDKVLTLGAIIGMVNVVRCWPTVKVRFAASDDIATIPLDGGIQVSESELAFGDYAHGRFAWQCTKPVRFAEPVPCRGFPGIFNPSPEVLAAVEAQMQAVTP